MAETPEQIKRQRDDYAALLSAKDREIDTLKKQIAKLEDEIARLKTKP